MKHHASILENFTPQMQSGAGITCGRITSLLDMLQIDSRPLFAALTYISAIVGQYRAILELSEAQGRTGHFIFHASLNDKAELLKAIDNLGKSCADHGLNTTSQLAQAAFEQCGEILASRAPIDTSRILKLLPILHGLPSSFVTEAQNRKFFAMSGSSEPYHKSADELFGPKVIDAFPNAAFDIQEAGRCQAFELWTASVMHIMRVLEIGLQGLADHVGVEHQENWNKTLNLIEVKLREVRRKVDGSEAEQWAAETGTHLRFVKNAWRNQAMHPQAVYDEARAKGIFDNAKSFMNQLAEKIDPHQL